MRVPLGGFHSASQVIRRESTAFPQERLKMPINVKAIDTIAAKFAQRASAAGPAYAAGVASPRRSWQAATTASAQSWADGVTAAVQNGRFTKGVSKAGDAKWQANASGVGAQRYPQGASNAQPAYSSGFAPYLSVIASLNLPQRYPRGDTRNIDRVSAVDAALHTKKVQG